jgi:hypothetical protein
MLNDERFAILKERFEGFEEIKKSYFDMIEEKRNAAAQTIISKGAMFNVLPFENEQHGNKVKGKVLPEPIIHDDCRIYHLDGERRVLLEEMMSEFLKMPANFSLYTYFDDYIECIHGTNHEVIAVSRAYLCNGMVKEMLSWAVRGCSISFYDYEQSTLTAIRVCQREHLKEDEIRSAYEFSYDTKGALSCIRRVWENGGSQVEYSTMKINYKALEQRLFTEAEKAVSEFLQQNKAEKFTRFSLDCYSAFGYIVLCLDTDDDEEILHYPACWKYPDFATLDLIDFPLNDTQEKKVHKTIIKVADDLLKADFFSNLAADDKFKFLVFDHHGLLISL